MGIPAALYEVFVRSFPVAEGDPEEIEVALADLWRRAHDERALPVEPLDFVRHVAERLPRGAPPIASLAALFAGDLLLACGCTRGERRSLDAFERGLLPDVSRHLAPMNEPEWFVDDVRQLLREKLLFGRPGGRARIAEYSGRAPLRSWVRIIAVRTAIDLVRRRRHDPLASSTDVAESLPAGADPELDYLHARYRAEFEGALRTAIEGLASEERNVLRLHLIDGLNLDRIGALYGISKATAWRRLQSHRDTLMARTRAVLRERLGIGESSLETLMRAVRSQLDLSLHGLLID